MKLLTMDNTIISLEKRWFYIKFALMMAFICFDVVLNSKIEFEALTTGGETSKEKLSQHQMLLFGWTIVFQFSVAAAFFLILCSTFPFQVGLLFPFQDGIFKWLLVLQLVYMILSCIVGGIRLNKILVSNDTNVFRSWVYKTASAVHKLVAPCYYAASLRSALSLGHKRYYTRDIWIPAAPAQQTQQQTSAI